jgi:CheY-like chemotaxis protein
MTRDLRLLYVEDDADIRHVVAMALEDEGFDLRMCASGHEALTQAPEFQPDVVMLDVMMPNMDGPTVLRHLRELPGLDATPVIFITARVQPKEVERFKALGAIDVIAKPFDPLTLGEQIRGICEGARGN